MSYGPLPFKEAYIKYGMKQFKQLIQGQKQLYNIGTILFQNFQIVEPYLISSWIYNLEAKKTIH